MRHNHYNSEKIRQVSARKMFIMFFLLVQFFNTLAANQEDVHIHLDLGNNLNSKFDNEVRGKNRILTNQQTIRGSLKMAEFGQDFGNDVNNEVEFDNEVQGTNRILTTQPTTQGILKPAEFEQGNLIGTMSGMSKDWSINLPPTLASLPTSK